MNEVAFRELQESQRLTLNFEQYPQLLHRVLSLCVEVWKRGVVCCLLYIYIVDIRSSGWMAAVAMLCFFFFFCIPLLYTSDWTTCQSCHFKQKNQKNIQDPNGHTAIVSLQRNFQARLDVIQNQDFKVVDLLSIRFCAAPDDLTRAHVSYRYNSLKSRMAVLQSHVSDLQSTIKQKNPSLLLAMGKKILANQTGAMGGGHALASSSGGSGVRAYRR